jgi:hypothetical protein
MQKECKSADMPCDTFLLFGAGVLPHVAAAARPLVGGLQCMTWGLRVSGHVTEGANKGAIDMWGR